MWNGREDHDDFCILRRSCLDVPGADCELDFGAESLMLALSMHNIHHKAGIGWWRTLLMCLRRHEDSRNVELTTIDLEHEKVRGKIGPRSTGLLLNFATITEGGECGKASEAWM